MSRFPKLSRFVVLVPGTLVFIVLAINGCQQQKNGRPEKITITYLIKFNSNVAQIAFAGDCFKVKELGALLKLDGLRKSAFQADISQVLYGHV